MEVFIRNLPAEGNLSERGLLVQLRPFMRRLNIPDWAYDCEKALTKKHANVTFLYEKHGQAFLDTHGEVGKGRSRLVFLAANVLCRRSNRPPHRSALRRLAAQAEEAQRPQNPRRAPEAGTETKKLGDITFSCRALSCGYYRFVGSELRFVPEYGNDGWIVAKFGQKTLTILRKDDTIIRIPLNTIQEIVWSPSGALTLTLTTVPFFFSPLDVLQDNKRWRLTRIDSEHSRIVGMCLVYRVWVWPEGMQHKMQKLSNLGSLAVSRFEVAVGSGPSIVEGQKRLHMVLSDATTKSTLPFSLLLQLQALAFNAYLHPETVADLATALCTIYKDTPISPAAMKTLFHDIAWPSPNHPDPSEFEVSAILDHLVATEKRIQDGLHVRGGLLNPGQNLTPIHRVVISPTRVTLHGPELENKNRVLRKFPNHHDYFIRVQFCEEDGQNLRFSGWVELALVYGRFKTFMLDGVQIAGRTYKFLGWSHSSLRAHSMWFSAPFMDASGQLQTHFNIISTLGQFGKIFSPARNAARIGQAFSETPFAVPLAENNICVVEIPDVKSPDRQRVFSDGVGTISKDAASVIWKNLPAAKKQPTCLQIRYAGAKGMLSLDPRLDGRQICLRPSMVKFESDETANLEICDMGSRPITLYLNRQLIKILEDIGVPTSWFLRLQNEALKELRLIASSTYNMAHFVKSQSVATAIRFHKILLLADDLGLDYRTDSFLRRATEAVILRELRLLKQKARIFVPLGITLFGVMDETGLLHENEVYVTFEATSGPKAQRSQEPPRNRATLLVTRSPALHPGDVQLVVNAIPPDKHPLRSLRNCIVFSAHGSRDLPSQLSGGDLDGDIFHVIWDPDVCNLPTLQTYKPADYPRQAPADLDRPVERKDIADFFINFMQTDHLGAIAIRHMILADQLDDGTLDRRCIAIAEMHSTAVDFSKTGIPADLRALPYVGKFRPDFLSPGPIVQIYDKADINAQDFIEDSNNDDDGYGLDAPAYKYYRSEKILGTLYRAIDEKELWKDSIRRPTEESTPSFYDAFLVWATRECEKLDCRDWRRRNEEALRIRFAYEDAVVATKYDFAEHPTQPITELEVFIGSIMNKTGSQTIRQRDRSRKLRDEYERISAWITAQIRTPTGDGDEDWLERHLETLELCLACAYSRKLSKADSLHADYYGQQRREENEVESFWLVAASALIRELELIKHGLEADAQLEMERDMAQLAMSG